MFGLSVEGVCALVELENEIAETLEASAQVLLQVGKRRFADLLLQLGFLHPQRQKHAAEVVERLLDIWQVLRDQLPHGGRLRKARDRSGVEDVTALKARG